VHEQVLDQIMVVNFNDNEQSFESTGLTAPQRRVRPAKGEKSLSTRRNYFMTNPSLSGRGDALKSHAPKRIAQHKRRKKANAAESA
jgi:polyphosphate kinase